MADDVVISDNEDALFLERLDFFLEKSLDDLREFARREERDFAQSRGMIAQIRFKAAEWHSKYLFEVARAVPNNSEQHATAQAIVNDVLVTTSRTLESLLEVAGRHSLLLVVDPSSTDGTDEGFLGGTTVGREFWRGMRNGGALGARNFKEYSIKASGIQPDPQFSDLVVGTKQSPAGTMKNNLYVEMRSRLRAISGVRNAEMKWTKPERLSVYGVALEGWPRNIQYKNPSKMSFQESSTIMKLLQDNKIYFRPTRPQAQNSAFEPSESTFSSAAADVSWAVIEDNQDTLL